MNPYPIYQDETSQRSLIALNIVDVKKEKLTKTFIKTLSQLKSVKPHLGYYEWNNFYPVLLSKLQGKIVKPDYNNDFLENMSVGIYMSSLLCIQNVLITLLKEEYGQSCLILFKKIWLEFEFILLNEYKQLDKIDPNLLNEINQKIAYDTSKLITFLHEDDIKSIDLKE